MKEYAISIDGVMSDDGYTMLKTAKAEAIKLIEEGKAENADVYLYENNDFTHVSHFDKWVING